MAACTTSYFEESYSYRSEAAEWNRKFLERQAEKRRGASTPEFYFARHFDNSRLVKTPDPKKARQMRTFSCAVTFLFVLVMIYGLQHFSAIEGGYRVEAEKQTLDKLREENRQLRLSEAQLTQPVRIDQMARQMGLSEPEPGQVVQPSAHAETGAPVMAQVTTPALPAK